MPFNTATQPTKNEMATFNNRNEMPSAIAQPVFRRTSMNEETKQHIMLTAEIDQSTRAGGPFWPLVVPIASTSAAGRNATTSAKTGGFDGGLAIGGSGGGMEFTTQVRPLVSRPQIRNNTGKTNQACRPDE